MTTSLFAAAVPGVETVSRGEELLQAAYRWLTENGLKFAASLVVAVLIYLVGAWVARMFRGVLQRTMVKRGMDQTFASYMANILHSVIMVLVFITALGQLGIPTAQFAALIAAAGLAIGLALQGNLSNFASGFLLVLFRPFKRGDYIMAGGSEGTVEEIGVFTSTLTTSDNRRVMIPNSAITGGNITNFTVNPSRLVAVACTVGADNSSETVRTSMLSASKGNPHLLADPAPVVVLTQLGENKFTMELRAWCPADKYWATLFGLNEAVKAAFERDSVAGPLPAMKVIQANVSVPARI